MSSWATAAQLHDSSTSRQAMIHYDPEIAPNPADWLALDEQARFALVEQHHRKARIRLPNLQLHAIVHSVVENQIAEGHEPVIRAMARLARGGLTRHEAVHAVGSVLAVHIYDLLKDASVTGDPMIQYDAEIERLTAESWRRS